eukprot:351451-Chlamydomonas_euryale.AAC.6
MTDGCVMGEWMDQGHAQCESVRRAAAAASGAPTGTDQIDNPCASHSPCWSTLQAAEVLSCRPLLEYCQGRLGQMAQGVRIHRFGDVVAANAAGNVWLILDSMVWRLAACVSHTFEQARVRMAALGRNACAPLTSGLRVPHF